MITKREILSHQETSNYEELLKNENESSSEIIEILYSYYQQHVPKTNEEISFSLSNQLGALEFHAPVKI